MAEKSNGLVGTNPGPILEGEAPAWAGWEASGFEVLLSMVDVSDFRPSVSVVKADFSSNKDKRNIKNNPHINIQTAKPCDMGFHQHKRN